MTLGARVLLLASKIYLFPREMDFQITHTQTHTVYPLLIMGGEEFSAFVATPRSRQSVGRPKRVIDDRRIAALDPSPR
jgi:hypothetical protein